MAAPSKLTPETHRRLLLSLKHGNFRETAAADAGIDARTLRSWMKQAAEIADRVLDENGELPPDAELTDHERAVMSLASDVQAAEAEMQTRALLKINKAADTDWRAAAWTLERRFPKQFGQKAEIEHTGKDGGPLQASVVVLPPIEPPDPEQPPADGGEDGEAEA